MNLIARARQAEQSTMLAELHTYVNDLQRYTLLRDRAPSAAERDNYTTIILCMQRAAVHLNAAYEKALAK